MNAIVQSYSGFKSTAAEYASAAYATVKREPLSALIKNVMGVGACALVNVALIFVINSPVIRVSIGVISFIFWRAVTNDAVAKVLYAEYRQIHACPNVANPRELLLVIDAQEDHNGALQTDQRSHFQALENDYDIVFKSATSTKEIGQIIDEADRDKKIKVLWLNAHGSKSSLSVGKSPFRQAFSALFDHYSRLIQSLDGSQITHATLERDLEKSLNDSLTPDATIILLSCATGTPTDRGTNIANELARITKRKVFAPTDSVPSDSIRILQRRPLNVKFILPLKATMQGAIGSIQQIFYNMQFKIWVKLLGNESSSWLRDVTSIADGCDPNFWPWPVPN